VREYSRAKILQQIRFSGQNIPGTWVLALRRARTHLSATMPDTNIELYGLRDAASLTGFNITNIRAAQPELGPAERGIDVLFDLAGRRLGAQHTMYHSDEGHTPGKRGSPARAKEEATARAMQTPFGMWGVFDYRPALWRRVAEKIAIARRHDNRRLVAETWLIISASLASGARLLRP
jgi:hypothetical protein